MGTVCLSISLEHCQFNIELSEYINIIDWSEYDKTYSTKVIHVRIILQFWLAQVLEDLLDKMKIIYICII